jgi:hypothetical protein
MPRRKPMQVTSTPKALLSCSFCHRDRHQVGELVAGPGVHICKSCVGLCQRVFSGKPTAPFAGWEALTDEELLATLPASSASVDASATLHEHVDTLRQRGVSWERIATALGVSRQAAWERFSNES